MKLCRFKIGAEEVRIGLLIEANVVADLSAAGVSRLERLPESKDLSAVARE